MNNVIECLAFVNVVDLLLDTFSIVSTEFCPSDVESPIRQRDNTSANVAIKVVVNMRLLTTIEISQVAKTRSNDPFITVGHNMQEYDMAIPVLPSRSVDDTLAFYRRLGFEGKFWGTPYFYAILTRGTIELHFFTHKELCPAESTAGCYIRVSEVDSLYEAFALAELPRTGIPRQDALEDKPWGMREFAIVDPDGNLMRIGQSI